MALKIAQWGNGMYFKDYAWVWVFSFRSSESSQ